MGYYLDTWPSPNTNGGGYPKEGFCIHHAATTNFQMIGQTFQNTQTQTSAHYGVEPGHVQQYLADDDNAWATGNAYGNSSLISIECVNATGDPTWTVADATVDTLVEFMADKCREHGWGHLTVGENLFGHRDLYNTYCPGDDLYSRLVDIADRVNANLNGEEVDDLPTPSDVWNYGLGQNAEVGNNDMAAWKMLSWTNHDTAALFKELCRTDNADGLGPDSGVGIYGRIVAIDGYCTQLAAQVAALTEAVKTLAESKGADPDEVAKAVSDAVQKKLETIKLNVSAE